MITYNFRNSSPFEVFKAIGEAIFGVVDAGANWRKVNIFESIVGLDFGNDGLPIDRTRGGGLGWLHWRKL